MLAFPAPSPESAASSIGALVPTSADGDTISEACSVPTAPLAALPTTGLIVRAWCGLALWAISNVRDAHAYAAAGAAIAGGSDAAAPVDWEAAVANPGARAAAGNRSGEGNERDDVHGSEGDRCGPLRAIFGSVLQGALPAAGAIHRVGESAITTPVTNSGAAETSDVAIAEALAARGRRERVAEWNIALFPSLMRVLSRASPHGISRTEEGHAVKNTETRAEEPQKWLQTPVSLLVPPIAQPRFGTTHPSDVPTKEPQAAMGYVTNDRAGGQACSECRGVEDVVGALLREWGVGSSARGSREVFKSGVGKGKSSRKHAESNPQEKLPLWIWLLVGGLREPCNCHLAPSTSAAEAGSRAAVRCHAEPAGGHARCRRVEALTSQNCRIGVCEGVVAAQEKSDANLLCEILELSPKGGPGQVLAALSRGAAALAGNGVRSDRSHIPIAESTVERSHEKQQRQREETSVVRTRNSCIRALAKIWGAEASRNVRAWDAFRQCSLLRGVTGGNGRLESGFKTSAKRPKRGRQSSIEALHQPAALLVGATDDFLRAPLKLALLLSLLPETPAATVSAGKSESAAASLVDRNGQGRSVGDGGMMDEEPAAQSKFDQDSALDSLPAAGGKPWGNLGNVGVVFGPEAASLWRKLFAARQGHPAGFAKGLLRRLSKDCASLAFSTPQAASAPSSSPATGASEREGRIGQLGCQAQSDPLFSGGWGLTFSQTQLTQKDAEGETATDREGRRRSPQTPGPAQKGSIPEELGSKLGPTPPSSVMPLLAAVTLSLLRASAHEIGVTRTRAWGAGLASLAWLLASPVLAQPAPCVAPRERSADGSTEHSASSGGRGGNAAGTPAAVMGAVSAVELGDCLDAVHRSVSSWCPSGRQSGEGVGIDGGGGGLPLDKESLTPVCRFLTSGIRRWSTGGAGDAGRVSCETACLFSHSTLRPKIRAVIVSLLSAVKGLAKEALASSDVLGALSPLLIAILNMLRSR